MKNILYSALPIVGTQCMAMLINNNYNNIRLIIDFSFQEGLILQILCLVAVRKTRIDFKILPVLSIYYFAFAVGLVWWIRLKHGANESNILSCGHGMCL